MRDFTIPEQFRSDSISALKRAQARSGRSGNSPLVLDLGRIRFKIARSFGFCFGVQNAIETAYRALEEQPGRRIFLVSEMIHNQHVNEDLQARGVRFLQGPHGQELLPLSDLRADDVVIVPAFGISLEMVARLKAMNIDARRYDATCPFVERVWKKAGQLGEQGFTIVIHGKRNHEETRATFSHASITAPSVIVRDLDEARRLGDFIRGRSGREEFGRAFQGACSEGFDPDRDLRRIGVVNQTTMLAEHTQAIAAELRTALADRFGADRLPEHYADTRDTLCYATSENQSTLRALVDSGGDLAVVVGGYNSSNTSHLVEISSRSLPTYYIQDAGEIESARRIRHFDLRRKTTVITEDWLPLGQPDIDVLLTAGASCPDSIVDGVLRKISISGGVGDRFEAALAACLEGLQNKA